MKPLIALAILLACAPVAAAAPQDAVVAYALGTYDDAVRFEEAASRASANLTAAAYSGVLGLAACNANVACTFDEAAKITDAGFDATNAGTVAAFDAGTRAIDRTFDLVNDVLP